MPRAAVLNQQSRWAAPAPPVVLVPAEPRVAGAGLQPVRGRPGVLVGGRVLAPVAGHKTR